MRGIEDEEGIAYGLVAVLMFLAMASLIFICLIPVMNNITGVTNDMAADGDIGIQTMGAMEWGIGWFAAIPVLALLGIMAWACIRSLEERGE